MSSLIDKIDKNRLPQHVAIIMDGNGRWAQQHNLPRAQGHVEGVTAVRRITEIASDLGVKYLTLYTFSTENWNRPQEEIDSLMHLIVLAIEKETPGMIENNVRLRVVGDMSRVPAFARERLEKCMTDTEHCTGLTMCMAISYSSKWEIVNACKCIARQVEEGKMRIEDITEDVFNQNLNTRDYPDPDLLIRTAGDLRVSNFLLWQIAYSELYFTPVYWPAFTKDDFCEAILDYQSRERRFGKTSEQIKEH